MSERIVISEFMDAPAVERLRGALRRRLPARAGRRRRGARRRRCAGADGLDRAQPHPGARARCSRPPRGVRVVGRLGVGLDNIDVDACAARGIEVIPATGANARVGRRVRGQRGA